MGFNLKKELKKARKKLEKAARNVGKAAEKAVRDTANVVVDAHVDAANVVGKAHEDTARATVKAAKDTLDAAKATARYLESKGQSYIDAAADAERRLREGKVLDALWHLGVDPYRVEEANSLKAMQESHLIRTVCQVGASAYGGPYGAAAFAAWYAYRTTGDADMAFRVGVISGLTSAGMSATGKIPVEGWEMAAAKATIGAAIGGLGVAASGGDAAAIREGIIRSGLAILIQDRITSTVGQRPDLRAADEPPLNLRDLPEQYRLLDADGKPVMYGPDNEFYRVDFAKIYPRHSLIGSASDSAGAGSLLGDQSPVMLGVGKIPGMNAMALFHDKWVVSWRLEGTSLNQLTIPPAIVFTYMGTDSHLLEEIRKGALSEAVANAATLPKPAPAVIMKPPQAAPKPKPKPNPPRDRHYPRDAY